MQASLSTVRANLYLLLLLIKKMARKAKLTLSIGRSPEERNRYTSLIEEVARGSGCTSISQMMEKIAGLNDTYRVELSVFLRKRF